jgi:hypothetical protein
MVKTTTALLRALVARWTVKTDDEVAQRGRHIKQGCFGELTYRDPCFPTLRDAGSFFQWSFPIVGRTP